MSRCTCLPMCDRCGDGPCDCNCTKEQLAEYKAEMAKKASLPQRPEGAAVGDDSLRKLWRDNGGEFHGPKVETGTMPEALLLPFLRSLVSPPASAVAEPDAGKFSGYVAVDPMKAAVDETARKYGNGRFISQSAQAATVSDAMADAAQHSIESDMLGPMCGYVKLNVGRRALEAAFVLASSPAAIERGENTHDDLVAALRTVDEYCQSGLNSGTAAHMEAALNDVLEIIRAALPKSEKGR